MCPPETEREPAARAKALAGILAGLLILSQTCSGQKAFRPAQFSLARLSRDSGWVSPNSDLSARDSAFHPLPAPDTTVQGGRVAIIGATLGGSMAAIHLYQQSGWWKDNRTPFHFQEDLVYGLNVDKIGHFFGATVLQFVFSRSLTWANVKDRPALWWGAGGALLFQTYVEVEDGFSTWGFDRVDFASDLGGAAWPVARAYVPALNSVDLKMSYHQSPLLGSAGGIGFKGQKHLMIDDYEGQTFWLSVKVRDLAPSSIWPPFLCLAAGYAARDVAGPVPYRVYFVALDLDFTRLIPQSSQFLRDLSIALNFIHMPLPAVRVSPGVIWYGAYF